MMSDKIEFHFNGETVQSKAGTSIAEYLIQQGTQGKFLVVVNDEVVPSSQYDTTIIQHHDAVDIITAISGG